VSVATWRDAHRTNLKRDAVMHLPSDPAQRPPQVTLTKGLRARLLPLPHNAQAAVLVRVHAGSHDAPRAYPGLAHFLEHLLFLGSRDYPAAQSLMPFVQGCGGQLNASTRERHTDFFFQLPNDQLEEGLRRLLDMLAHPLLDRTAQLREREVLHAEFLARAQDVETLCDAALSTVFEPGHPFAGFHAGNRDTLPVEDELFQQALLGYHQRFYHSGQIELLLAGPQSAEELQRLAALVDSSLAPGRAVTRAAPALRCKRDAWLRLQTENAQPRLHLAFALDGMPEHCRPALDYLSTWIASEAPGGLVQRLRDEDLCQSLKLRVPYWYARQGVAVVELLLTERGLSERALVVEAVLDWLRFFSDEACWQPCRDEYRRVHQRSLQGAEPLMRLRHWVEPQAWSDDSDEAAIHHAFGVLLGQMVGVYPLILTVDRAECEPIESQGFPLRLAFELPQQAEPNAWGWKPPALNPWLRPSAERYEARGLPQALRWLGPADANAQAALFLRWQFAAGEPPSGLGQAVSHAMQSSRWAAQQAGVLLRFEDIGTVWSLGLLGFADAIPAIAGDLALLMAKPPAVSIAQGRRLAERDALGGDDMLIRQLLQRLPRLLASGVTKGGQVETLDHSTLFRCWQSAQWQGLAVGFAPALSGPLGDALNVLPGAAEAKPMVASTAPARNRWHDVSGGVAMNETAMILFCPLPERSPECEASWRVLARLIAGDFFRRLRSELQLGYAVFSRFHQLGGQSGMLFGVQSPSASAGQILEHIQTFLASFALKLADQPAAAVERAAIEAGERHLTGPADLRAWADQVWQCSLAGHEVTRPSQVAAAMCRLQRADLTAALEALRAATGGWVVVANAPAPDARWG
jgi:coenzyme PQQ biosynthesis probable peptidase PqqF